jgi:MOSC domain-containing protein YiiM
MSQPFAADRANPIDSGPGPGPGTDPGRLEAIHTAPREGAPMQVRASVVATPGIGLEGDRYALETGHYSPEGRATRDVTLIESEVLDDLRAHGIEFAPGESRRNLTTSGVRLNNLVGRRFRVGDVECRGVKLCEPCDYLVGLTGKPVLKPLVHRGGLRADIVSAGTISVGDEIVVLAD